MLKRLWLWFVALFASEQSVDLYQPKQRMIYKYWNGKKVVEADPLVLYKAMMNHGPELSVDIRVANSASKDAGTAHDSLLDHIRNIFGLKPLEEGGLTNIETAEVLDHFLRYCEHCKKKSKTSPISSTETSVDTPPSSNGSPHTENTLDSGSTASEPNIADPKVSPTA